MANGHVSNTFADNLVKVWLTRDITFLPTNYFIGLTTVLPTDQNGSGLLAPTASEYARIQVAASSASWVSLGVGSRAMQLNVELLYSQAVTDWGEIRGYTIYDALTAGTYLGYGVVNPVTIRAAMKARLPAGSVVITLPY